MLDGLKVFFSSLSFSTLFMSSCYVLGAQYSEELTVLWLRDNIFIEFKNSYISFLTTRMS